MFVRQVKYAVAFSVAVLAFPSLGSATALDPNQAVLAVLKESPDAMSAIKLLRGNGAIFCTLGKAVKGEMVTDNDRSAMLHSPELRAWHGRGDTTSYAEIVSGVDGLLESMQNGRCNVAVENASNIIALAESLQQAGMRFSILPSALYPEQIADLYATSLGLTSSEDLLLARYMKVNNEELQAYYKLGITTREAYDNALVRMRAQGYSNHPRDLRAFLKDEAQGAPRNISASDIRDERKSAPAPGAR